MTLIEYEKDCDKEEEEEEYDTFYYYLGDYIYTHIQPEVKGDLDMFKYILGRFYFSSII